MTSEQINEKAEKYSKDRFPIVQVDEGGYNGRAMLKQQGCYVGYIDGYTAALQSPDHTSLRWVKASERMPTKKPDVKDNWYCLRQWVDDSTRWWYQSGILTSYETFDGFENIDNLWWLESAPDQSTSLRSALENLTDCLKKWEPFIEPDLLACMTAARAALDTSNSDNGKLRVEELEKALRELCEAVPKQSEDMDWWEDNLTQAYDNAMKLLTQPGR